MSKRFAKYTLALLFMTVAAACSTGSVESEQLGTVQSTITLPVSCHYAGDCNTGEDCVDEVCAATCTTTAQCPTGYACTGGYCRLPCGLFVNYGTPAAPDCAPHPCRSMYCIEGTECDGPSGDCYIP